MAERHSPTSPGVANQPPPFEGVNLFASDNALREAVAREGGAGHAARIDRFGAKMGAPETWGLASPPHRHAPERGGFRRDARPALPRAHQPAAPAPTPDGL